MAGGIIPTLWRVRATRMEVATAIKTASMVALAVTSAAGAKSVTIFLLYRPWLRLRLEAGDARL
jgi:hypothetical protein